MRNTIFKCPICGSNHFKHSFSRDKSLEVFIAKCSKCFRYECWVNKKDYFNWIHPDRNKLVQYRIIPTTYGKNQVFIHELLLHFGFIWNASNKWKYKLNKNNCEYKVDVLDKTVRLKNIETNKIKVYTLDSLINKLIKLSERKY